MTIEQPRSTAGKWFLGIMFILNFIMYLTVVILLPDVLSKEKLASPILLIAFLIYLVCSTIQFLKSSKRSIEIPNLTDILNQKKVYKLVSHFYLNEGRLTAGRTVNIFGFYQSADLLTVYEIFPKTGPEIICAHSVVPPKKFCVTKGGHLKEINDGDYDTLCSTNKAQDEARTKIFA